MKKIFKTPYILH